MVFSTNLAAQLFKQLQTRLYKYSINEKVLTISLKWASKFNLESSMTPKYLYCLSYYKTVLLIWRVILITFLWLFPKFTTLVLQPSIVSPFVKDMLAYQSDNLQRQCYLAFF